MIDFIFHYWLIILVSALITGMFLTGLFIGISDDNWSLFQGNFIFIPIIFILIAQINYRDETILYLMQEKNLTEKEIKDINSTKYPYIKEILVRKYLELKKKELK